MPDPTTPNAERLGRITTILRVAGVGVPLALLAVLGLDGLDWTDAGVIALTTAVLWLFVGIASFTVGALHNLDQSTNQPPRQ